jgi:hypothetical protein
MDIRNTVKVEDLVKISSCMYQDEKACLRSVEGGLTTETLGKLESLFPALDTFETREKSWGK